MTAKADIIELVRKFPDAVTFDDAVARLRKLYPEQRGPCLWWREQTAPPKPGFTLKKAQILDVMRHLPDQLSRKEAIDEAAYQLYVVFKIEIGLEEARNGQGIPHEEVVRRFAKWRR